MPPISQAQRRFMYATAEGKTNVKPSVGKDFVNAGKGVTNLPEFTGDEAVKQALHKAAQVGAKGGGKQIVRSKGSY